MTLFITHARRDVQIVVADRKVTGKHGSESAYKIFLYVNMKQRYRFAATYTGLSKYEKHSTVDWLMDSLPNHLGLDVDIGNGISSFTEYCTEYFNNIRGINTKQKALTIVLCGSYTRLDKKLLQLIETPFTTVISNHVDKTGRQINKVLNHFSAYSARLFKPDANITLCRGDLETADRHYSKEFRSVCRLLRKNISYRAKIQILTEYVRTVASQSKTVGKDVLGIALPRGENIVVGFDFHEDNKNLTYTMPHFVSADGSKMVNFKTGI